MRLGAQIIAEAQAEIQSGLSDQLREIREATLSRDEILDIPGAAELLKVSDNWIRERVKRQNRPIPAMRDGVIRIKKTDLLAWFDAETMREVPKIHVMPTGKPGEIPIRRRSV